MVSPGRPQPRNFNIDRQDAQDRCDTAVEAQAGILLILSIDVEGSRWRPVRGVNASDMLAMSEGMGERIMSHSTSCLLPNEFELAILHHLARKLPGLAAAIPGLRVLSRELTGVGSYTTFSSDEVIAGATAPLGVDNAIGMPGVRNGLDATLFFEGGKVKFLEIVAFGSEPWDGAFVGFSIPTTE